MVFIMLATLLLVVSLLEPRLPPRESGPIVGVAASRDPAYSTFVGLALGFRAFFIPFVYAESYGLDFGVHTAVPSSPLSRIPPFPPSALEEVCFLLEHQGSYKDKVDLVEKWRVSSQP
ncbi:hypothetical protein BDW75DRAFT_240990 [Aspergillus navahoensis]